MDLKVKRLVSQTGRKNMLRNINTAWSLVNGENRSGAGVGGTCSAKQSTMCRRGCLDCFVSRTMAACTIFYFQTVNKRSPLASGNLVQDLYSNLQKVKC